MSVCVRKTFCKSQLLQFVSDSIGIRDLCTNRPTQTSVEQIFEILISKFLANFFYILNLELVSGTLAAELSAGLFSFDYYTMDGQLRDVTHWRKSHHVIVQEIPRRSI